MRRLPTPSLILSIIAVVFSLAGTSIAAIKYASNAGAVDHLSAVKGTSSVAHATGKLVATQSSGTYKGKIPSRFLDLHGVVRGDKATFHQALPVTDNATGAPVTIGAVFGVGVLTAACDDQNTKAGIEDPKVRLSFSNGASAPLNVDRTVGNGAPTILAEGVGTATTFTISASNTFRVHAEINGVNYTIEGVVRQDGTGTADATCQVYGYSLTV